MYCVFNSNAQVLLSCSRPPHSESSPRLQMRWIGLGNSLHLQQEGASDQAEGDEHRGGIAGQADKWCIAYTAECQGFARFDGELPQIQSTQKLYLILDVILLANRDTTGGDHTIGARCSSKQRLCGDIRIIRNNAAINKFNIDRTQQSSQRITVRVVGSSLR